MNNKHVETIYLMMIAWNGIKLEEKKDCAPTPDLPPVARSPQTLIDYIARSFFFLPYLMRKAVCVSVNETAFIYFFSLLATLTMQKSFNRKVHCHLVIIHDGVQEVNKHIYRFEYPIQW